MDSNTHDTTDELPQSNDRLNNTNAMTAALSKNDDTTTKMPHSGDKLNTENAMTEVFSDPIDITPKLPEDKSNNTETIMTKAFTNTVPKTIQEDTTNNKNNNTEATMPFREDTTNNNITFNNTNSQTSVSEEEAFGDFTSNITCNYRTSKATTSHATTSKATTSHATTSHATTGALRNPAAADKSTTGFDEDTISFNAWEINEKNTKVTHKRAPRLQRVVRSRKETPKLERRKRYLLPDGCGPFGVGSFDVMTDPGPNGSFFRIFYPIEKWNIDEDTAIDYPPWIPSHRYSSGLTKYMKVIMANKIPKTFFMQFFEHLRAKLYIPTLTEEELISPQKHVEQIPIIVFSHGLASCRTLSSAICLDWASYGFVVAAVEHRDGSAAYTYHLKIMGNASCTKGNKNSFRAHRKSSLPNEFVEDGVLYLENGMMILNVQPVFDFGVRNHQLAHRRREMTNCLNALTKLNEGRGDDFIFIDPRTGRKGKIQFLHNETLKRMFKGRLKVNRAIASGHSFGGATGIVAVLREPRFKAAVVMDPWTTPLGPEVYQSDAFRHPFIIINSDQWLSGKKWLPFLRLLLADQVKTLAACPTDIGSTICTLRGTNHQSFTDFSLAVGPKLGKMLGMRAVMDPVLVLQYIRQLSIAFIKSRLTVHEVMWPQGSKHILELVKGAQHMDIKHGHRNYKNMQVGYELEIQRLVAFERQANKDKKSGQNQASIAIPSRRLSILGEDEVESEGEMPLLERIIIQTGMREGGSVGRGGSGGKSVGSKATGNFRNVRHSPRISRKMTGSLKKTEISFATIDRTESVPFGSQFRLKSQYGDTAKKSQDDSNASKISSVEYSEARSFYLKEKEEIRCCFCCQKEIRKVKCTGIQKKLTKNEMKIQKIREKPLDSEGGCQENSAFEDFEEINLFDS